MRALPRPTAVAVRLRLIDSVSTGLISMAGQFMTLNRHMVASRAQLRAFEADLKRIKTMGLLGGVAFGVGAAGLYAFKTPLEEAKKWTQEAARFASLGFGDKVNGTRRRQVRDGDEDVRHQRRRQPHAVVGCNGRPEGSRPLGDRGADPCEDEVRQRSRLQLPWWQAMSNERKFMDMLKVMAEFRGGIGSKEEFERQANYVQQAVSGSRVKGGCQRAADGTQDPAASACHGSATRISISGSSRSSRSSVACAPAPG